MPASLGGHPPPVGNGDAPFPGEVHERVERDGLDLDSFALGGDLLFTLSWHEHGAVRVDGLARSHIVGHSFYPSMKIGLAAQSDEAQVISVTLYDVGVVTGPQRGEHLAEQCYCIALVPVLHTA